MAACLIRPLPSLGFDLMCAPIAAQLQRIAERGRCIESPVHTLWPSAPQPPERSQRIASQQQEIRHFDRRNRDLESASDHVSEKLAYAPGTFHVERRVHPPYACRACEAVVAVGLMTAADRFGLHDLTYRGVTDTQGTCADKLHASVHASPNMGDVYDLSVPEVSPASEFYPEFYPPPTADTKKDA